VKLQCSVSLSVLSVGGWVFVGGCVTLEIACIDPHQTGFVGKGSDHLQLIKFWPSHAPGRGNVAGRKFLVRLTTASAHCLHLI